MQRTKRNPFTKEEDEKIKEIISYVGEDWILVSKHLHGRTPKQCHDRYINYLREGLKSGPWTKSEDNVLLKLYKDIGPKWSKMLKHLPGRSGNDIKNRWHKHLIKVYPNQLAVEISSPPVPKYSSDNFYQAESTIKSKMPFPRVEITSYIPPANLGKNSQNLNTRVSCIQNFNAVPHCDQLEPFHSNFFPEKTPVPLSKFKTYKTVSKIEKSQEKTSKAHVDIQQRVRFYNTPGKQKSHRDELPKPKVTSNSVNLFSSVSFSDLEMQKFFDDLNCFDTFFNESSNFYLDF